MKSPNRFYRGKPGKFLVGLLAVFCLFAISACGGGNSSSHVYDNAHVLDTSSVRGAASKLSYPLDIYTTSTFSGDQSAFQHTTVSKLNGNTGRVVMAIDTKHRYLYIARGSKVPLSQSGISQSVSAFSSHFNDGDYTGATLAAIDSMQNSIGGSGEGGNAFSGIPTTLLCIGLLIVVMLLVGFGATRRRARFGAMRASAPYQPPIGPYDQGNYYGPPNQGGGMNPWAAGGLGAAAGGFLGYELGKQAGEREAEERNDWAGGGGSFGDGGNFGGGDSFGGGGDFGGGSGDSFGGGDAGGGGNF